MKMKKSKEDVGDNTYRAELQEPNLKTVGFLGDNGTVYKRAGNMKKSNDKFRETRNKNKIINNALKKGWKTSKL